MSISFSSPFRGFYLSTIDTVKRVTTSHMVLVPFSGFLSFYKGNIDSLEMSIKFSSPFRGFYLSTMLSAYMEDMQKVLVPFSGFLSFYKGNIDSLEMSIKFSSPFRGFYLSTLNVFSHCISSVSSRPLFGVSIFLHGEPERLEKSFMTFSSPFRGFYLSTHNP